MEKRKAIYAGTFDPITLGHLDIIERASQLYSLYILVPDFPLHKKNTWLNFEERKRLVEDATEIFNTQTIKLEGLLADQAKELGCNVLIRGIRSLTDFAYEQSMADTNHSLNNELETICLFSRPKHSFLSSSMVREVAGNGGNIEQYLDQGTFRQLQEWNKL